MYYVYRSPGNSAIPPLHIRMMRANNQNYITAPPPLPWMHSSYIGNRYSISVNILYTVRFAAHNIIGIL